MKNNVNLYECTEKAIEFRRIIAENEGEIPDEILEDFLSNDNDIKEKIKACLHIIDEYKSLNIRHKDIIDKLNNKVKKRSQHIENIKENIIASMKLIGTDKIQIDDLHQVTIVRSKDGSIIIKNQDSVPVKFLKTTISVDKSSLKKAIKNNEIQPNNDFYIAESESIRMSIR